MAISVAAPICYAHLAAAQIGTFLKFEEMSDISEGSISVPELPRLHDKVGNSMFFC
jgi:eukaryotic translation initiation factor 2C